MFNIINNQGNRNQGHNEIYIQSTAKIKKSKNTKYWRRTIGLLYTPGGMYIYIYIYIYIVTLDHDKLKTIYHFLIKLNSYIC